MSRTATALVLTEPERLEERSFELPDAGPGQGILRVEACGLCGTDHEQFSGMMPVGNGIIPGHEIIGVIDQLGSGAAQAWGVEVGQRVAVEVFLRCGECDQCRAGTYRRCERHGLADMHGFVGVDGDRPLKGGYSTHLQLDPDALLLAVPDSLDPVLATVFNPLGAGLRWASELPGTGPGDVVAILGPGIRGLSAVAAVREVGAGFVMVTGAGPRDADRLARARDFGADLTVDVTTEDPVAALAAATGGPGADVVVDVTAKAPAALGQAVALARPGGTIVMAGARGSAETPGFMPDLIVFKELRILGALGVDAAAYQAALELLGTGKYPFADLPRRVVGFDGADELLRDLAGIGTGVPPVHAVITP